MTNIEKLRRRIIELIHGVSYDLANLKEEGKIDEYIKKKCPTVGFENELDFLNYILSLGIIKRKNKITLARLMQALNDKPNIKFQLCNYGYGDLYIECWEYIEDYTPEMLFNWKLTNKDGLESTLEDQTPETINQLTKLLLWK